MTTRTARLPPLNALRVFHTVVRHRSFRSAADELRVTPQAVSQQIKLLEDTLGQELFIRKGRAIEPNENAILLAHFVRAGFDEFAEGVRRLTKAGGRSQINVNSSPYFATRYLLDRLGRFRDILPDAELRLTTMIDLPDFVSDEVDVAIQWGFGTWKQYDLTLLKQDPKVICCTPAIAAKLKTPADLLEARLLHTVPAEQLWGNILAHLGVNSEIQRGDTRMQDAASMRRATVAGMGVGLLSVSDAEDDIAAGKIVAPFGMDALASMPPEQIPGFYLVLPKSHRRLKTIAAFCNWVEAEDWAAPPLL